MSKEDQNGEAMTASASVLEEKRMDFARSKGGDDGGSGSMNSKRLTQTLAATRIEVEEVGSRRTRRLHGGSTRFIRPLKGDDDQVKGSGKPSLMRTFSEPTGLVDGNSFGTGDMEGWQEPVLKRMERSVAAHRNKKKKKKHQTKMNQIEKKKNEITEDHEQYKITYCMMLGIRFSVSQQTPGSKADEEEPNPQDPSKADLSIDDFMRIDRIVFTPKGLEKTPAHELKFIFKDYASEVFRKLREKFGIDDGDYLTSLASSYNYLEFITNSKSGQFFFYSNDGHYLIKTQTQAESKFLRQIMPEYYMYMMEHDDSLLVRICGMHRIKLDSLRKPLHFVILKSVYFNAASKRIHTVYDLKGSTIGRAAKRGEAVFKDLDLTHNKQKFKLGPMKEKFMTQLEEDARFLANLHIMDYSLLVGIHNKLAVPRMDEDLDTLTGRSSRALGVERAISQRMSQLPRGGSSKSLLSFARAQHAAEGASSEDDKDSEDDASENEDSVENPEPDSIFSPFEAVDINGIRGTEIYYFGVIDILQQYNARKRTENIFRSIMEGGEEGISAINPTRYADRFIRFIRENIE